MNSNWVEEALRAQQRHHTSSIVLTPSVSNVQNRISAGIAAPGSHTPPKTSASARRAARRWLLVLGLSLEALIGVSLPSTSIPFIELLTPGHVQAGVPRYAHYEDGAAVLPAGIRNVRVIDRLGVATTTARWNELTQAQQVKVLSETRDLLPDISDLSVFHPDGRLAGLWRNGRVEVLP